MYLSNFSGSEAHTMNGKSHVIVNFTSAVVLNSVFHVADKPIMWKTVVYDATRAFNWNTIVTVLREPLLLSATASSLSVVHRLIFYSLMLVGALFPDIDHPGSTFGRKFGWLSQFINRRFGHRTLTHSFVGFVSFFVFWMVIGLGTLHILALRGFIVSPVIVRDLWLSLEAIIVGCSVHVVADALTRAGVKLFWPVDNKDYGIPFQAEWRFLVGSWTEAIVVAVFVFAVGIGVGVSFFGF